MGGSAAQKIDRSADAFQAGHGLLFSRTERRYKPALGPTKGGAVTVGVVWPMLGWGGFGRNRRPRLGFPLTQAESNRSNAWAGGRAARFYVARSPMVTRMSGGQWPPDASRRSHL